jgi:dephospho-CoA kinase
MGARRPLRVALTGGIATGKSSVAREFAALGVPVVDADVLAREAVEPGTPGFEAIVARFGHDVLDAEGGLDRHALGARVFADQSERRALEAIVHPRVYGAIERWFADRAAEGAHVAVADIPLLFETGRASDFDRVVVAVCPPEQQLERLTRRDGLSDQQARQRIEAQWPLARKVAQADEVIDTGRTREDTRAQVRALAARLAAEAARAPTDD